MTDYAVCRLSKKEWLIYGIQSIFLCLFLNHIFYRRWQTLFLILPLGILYFKKLKREQTNKRKRNLHYQFKDMLTSLSVAVAAGYSLENALSEAYRDMKKMYGEQQDITKELNFMIGQMRQNKAVDELLRDLAVRSEVEDIMNFSTILALSKRMGGNMKELLQNAIRVMEEKIETKKEVDMMLAAKVMEKKMMCVIPLLIILYMQMTSMELIGVLYQDLVGAVIMTIALFMYLLSWYWGEKLIEIEI